MTNDSNQSEKLLISKELLVNLDEHYGISFANNYLLEKAFIHRSFPNEYSERKLENNERLEFLGDAVLELVITENLYDDYPDLFEGTLTSYRSALVRTENLASIALALGFEKHLLMSKGEISNHSNMNESILADTLESFIGALYLDAGIDVARKFVEDQIYYKLPEILSARTHIDPKTYLQTLVQAKFKGMPEYEILSSSGKDHEKIFVAGVKINGNIFAEGSGRSKQLAETDAAKNALESLVSSK